MWASWKGTKYTIKKKVVVSPNSGCDESCEFELPMAHPSTKSDAPPSPLLDSKESNYVKKAEVDGTWCRSQLPTLKGGERGVLKAPGLD